LLSLYPVTDQCVEMDANTASENGEEGDEDELEEEVEELSEEQLAEIEMMKQMGLPVQFNSAVNRYQNTRTKVKR